MNQPFSRQLVDERNGLAQRILHLGGIVGVDRSPNIPERIAEPRPHLAILFPTLDVLTVRFERGIVTGHCC